MTTIYYVVQRKCAPGWGTIGVRCSTKAAALRARTEYKRWLRSQAKPVRDAVLATRIAKVTTETSMEQPFHG